MENLKNIFIEVLKKQVSERADSLLEDDLNNEEGGKYFIKYDFDAVDIGVGHQIVRKDTIQDENEAWEDAKQELIEELENDDYETFYSLIDDENVLNAIIKLLGEC